MSYIERETLLDFLNKHKPVNWSDTDREIQAQRDFKMFIDLIENTLPADVKPVEHAYWKYDKDSGKGDGFGTIPSYWYCSNCGARLPLVLGGPFGDYCFNCGAEMDRDKTEFLDTGRNYI